MGQSSNRASADGRRVAVAAGVVAVCSIVLCGCGQNDAILLAQQRTDGNAGTGKHLIYSYGCGSCHRIPGIAQANANIGPPLTEFAYRRYIAGSLVNTPENLFRWIRDPQQIEPGTAMPNLGISERQAHHIAAYLYTLR